MQPGPGLKTCMDFRGLVWKRVWIVTFFGLKCGQDFKNPAAYPHQEFPGVPPWFSLQWLTFHSGDSLRTKASVPWIEMSPEWKLARALLMINQQRKYYLSYSTSKLVAVILSSGSIMYENVSPRSCALNSQYIDLSEIVHVMKAVKCSS